MNEKLEELFDKIKVQKTSAKEQIYTTLFVISTLVIVFGVMLSIQ